MKKILLLSAFLTFSMLSFAQHIVKEKTQNYQTNRRCNKYYINVSGGLNNPSSAAGVDFDYCISDKVSIFAGGGLLSTWGTKLSIGARYYTQPCHRGWAFGGGFTHNRGSGKNVFDLTLDNGTYSFSLNPITCMYASAYKFWSMGKRNNRFYLQLGLNATITRNKYTIIPKSGGSISDLQAAESVIKLLAPLPIVSGFGFSFGL